MKPLNEVKTYIQNNHHLPDVPSAAEVEKNGIMVGETNALLLKKIEELTLYLIDKDKEINGLNQQWEEFHQQQRLKEQQQQEINRQLQHELKKVQDQLRHHSKPITSS